MSGIKSEDILYGIDIGRMRDEYAAAVQKEAWDRWYLTIPDDLRRKLSLHDFRRLGDCFKTAFFGVADSAPTRQKSAK